MEAKAPPGGVSEGDLETEQDPDRVGCFSHGHWRVGATEVGSVGVSHAVSRSVHRSHHPLSIMVTKALEHAFT